MAGQIITHDRIAVIARLGRVRNKMVTIGLPVASVLLAVAILMYVFTPESMLTAKILLASLAVFVVVDLTYWILGSVVDVKREKFLNEFTTGGK